MRVRLRHDLRDAIAEPGGLRNHTLAHVARLVGSAGTVMPRISCKQQLCWLLQCIASLTQDGTSRRACSCDDDANAMAASSVFMRGSEKTCWLSNAA